MIEYGIGVALAVAAVAWPGSASMASPVQVNGTAHRADRAAAGPTPVAWVVNQSVTSAAKGSVTPIDTATNKVIKTIPVSANAIAVALAPDGKAAYVGLVKGQAIHGFVLPMNATTYRKASR